MSYLIFLNNISTISYFLINNTIISSFFNKISIVRNISIYPSKIVISKYLIKSSIINLLNEQSYSKISCNNLTDRINVLSCLIKLLLIVNNNSGVTI